jgi:transglutaminase-like putative cysteine protease
MSLRRLIVTLSSAFVCVLGIAGYYSAPVYAGDSFQPVSPEELKMTSEPQAPGAPAIVLFRQVDRDDTGRTAHENNYVRIKILTEEGRKYADVEIPFFKENGNNIINVRARTIRPDGSIANFEGKAFEKSIVKAQGLKYMAKTFTLPDVQVGSIVEYYYTLDLSEDYVYESHWILSDELFTRHAKFSLKPYTNSYIPVRVQWSWQFLPPGTGEPKEGPDHIIRLEVNNIPAFRTEDYMPPENELKSRVDFTYSEENLEKDPNQFWKKTGKKLNDQVESFIGKKGMQEEVAQIVSPDDSPEVKLQKIYARVQQLRNTSYEVRKTEQEKKREKEKEVSNVAEVWKGGYGNRRQLTWLFLALARAAGFEAYGVKASDRRNYFFNPNLMDPKKLDANVVLVKVNGKDVYCDPGAAFTPFGLLQWPETGVQGLRLDKNGGTWVRTVLPESSASRVERHADLTISSDTGELEGKLTITFTGLEAMQRRLEERNEDEADRKKLLEDQAKEYIPAASEVDLTNKPDWSSSSVPLVAEYHLKIPGWLSAAGRRALLPVGIFSATEKHVFDHAERTHPIYFRFPFEKLDDVNIALPPGWQVNSLPPEQNEGSDGSVVGYTLKVENNKQTLHLTRKLRVDFLLLETKYYPTLRNFFQVVRKGDEQQIVLQPGGPSAGN